MRKIGMIISLLSLLGCGRSPEPELFELASLPPKHQGIAPLRGVSVGVDSVTIPDYLDQKEIIVFTTPNHGQYTKLGQWAESPQSNMQNLLAGDLQVYLPGARVILSPWAEENSPARRVALRIQDAKFFANGRVELRANYKIFSARSGNQGQSYSVNYQCTVSHPNLASEIQALNALMHRLSHHIANNLARG